ncbi:hypothetical protein COLO4_31162 [Corchorus olitorius]|uniref:Protein kinase domain-containing protein n=1 Tax=Corchorus olitorius TaxID=93759 RepID=A0A1R3H587_9ROSI|nr:hypothetical protein COLO4_31162 [Corchorus olitorius]
MCTCYPWRRKVSLQSDEKEANSSEFGRKRSALPDDICRKFSLAEIKAATDNFFPLLQIGGGFGIVYKGTLNHGNGTMDVAVKRFEKGSSSAAKFFQNEVKLLCQLRHPNLVSLIGFCEENNEMILVYEHMGNGSLAHHLYGWWPPAPLSWKQRLRICIGAARGLHYLHTGAKYALLHGHVKTLNIFLDEENSCKLIGFSFSKMGPFSMSKASLVRQDSRVRGTYGYMAPEYTSHLEMTEKSEVYSFGIVLFEVLFGRRVLDGTLPWGEQNLLDWASEYIRKGTVYQVIDPYLKGKIAPECFEKYLEIACSCVHYDRNERPGMGEVEVTLELALELQEKANSHAECSFEESSFSTSINTCFDVDRNNFVGGLGHILFLD